ncbi:unnamed protein product [Prunus armeniaca]
MGSGLLSCAMGFDGEQRSTMAKGWVLRWFCDGGCCKCDGVCDGVCLQEERIFDGVGLDIRWGEV